ncbi:O-antigen ligase family protein [Bradyrhizobium septentrionale]|uniref:O-antigen ligase family protein n=1 Tax=Bradyrhizobium septentrionale TaxID=1404411 RepID=A0ABZ2NS97_9BRAD
MATATVAALPWSTTGFEILLLIWLLSIFGLSSTSSFSTLFQCVVHPFCLFPILIFVLAIVGMLWSEAAWPSMLYTIKSTVKFLALPLIAYHFVQSRRPTWVLIAFLASCSLLMTLSWIMFFDPAIRFSAAKNDGVPVKNYIDQSQEFALCMIAVAPLAMDLFKRRRLAIVVGLVALMGAFFANMMFVVSARTALVYMPAMLGLFAFRFLNRRQSMALLFAVLATAAAVWATSPFLRTRISDISREYQLSLHNIPKSTGQRLYYWQKSLTFFSEAPIVGHGTGSTEALFAEDAIGKTGLAAEVTRNPHNQTLNMAIQWGVLGIAVLYATWICHLLFFRGGGFMNWLGLLVVTQNILSSLLNSHLFDFQEGWIYVVGVGIAGGALIKACRDGPGQATVSFSS